jgi:uncharacterized protein YlxP (DUF503 family)
MIIGVLTLEMFFPYAHSLKDKRRILHGFKDRVRSRYNVALAEIDYQDKWQRALLAVVTLSGRAGVVDTILGKVLADAGRLEEGEVTGHDIRYC